MFRTEFKSSLLVTALFTSLACHATTNDATGTVSSAMVSLPDNMFNAKERPAVAHYIGRTAQEIKQQQVQIPHRNYIASCNTHTDSPSMFVSTTVQSISGDTHSSRFGAVYELKFNPQSGIFENTENQRVLNECIASHGISVSKDCKRVAVVCEKPHGASERDGHVIDLPAQTKGNFVNKHADNHATIDRAMHDLSIRKSRKSPMTLPSLIASNRYYVSQCLDNNPYNTLSVTPYIDTLVNQFGANRKKLKSFSTVVQGNAFKQQDRWQYLLNALPNNEQKAQFLKCVEAMAKNENTEAWLLEWHNEPLSHEYDAYVATKMKSQHLGNVSLNYSEKDQSYAIANVAAVYNHINGTKHKSAQLIVLQREGTTLKIDYNERGWEWNCGKGHVLHIRGYYDQNNDQFGAVCTTDMTDKEFSKAVKPHKKSPKRAHGLLAIKSEANSNRGPGTYLFTVPANNASFTRGGIHNFVPVRDNYGLSVAVAPKKVAESDLINFIAHLNITPKEDVYRTNCLKKGIFSNCELDYLSALRHNEIKIEHYPLVPTQNLMGEKHMDSTSSTRIGLFGIPIGGSRNTPREDQTSSTRWLVGDDNCQYSDPQLVNLHNGRFLLGYAKFQCVGDNQSLQPLGSDRALIPKTYHLVEINEQGDKLTETLSFTDYGWGGLDDLIYIGDGKVAWTYINNPTLSNHIGAQHQQWEVMVYQSSH
ncbi:hypothetical protein [Pseudoalteromonas luteoviolacea]|uniref:Uncharacterized protein n=1 Tax=Pseudoalteromonas luteoviolacea H33 TaxID=1365251 RepID=A0A162A5F3_9GAMM|nr:hypothetical protein [Pseudoalteromonas luteoviolacea]KZN44443.1 hypothetical protein N476_05460 [Pseudoalteromonas luteoviolacea H33]KZN78460.1 hypothetical protein N477_08650 [Pseudoalteromonas luteoviolacea H33-S]MBQ4878064.1 hypothetical protein [Pseudoalteromonas luteoviolacea]MBQ4907082.1 hypothetical protein [Pseudoalteromonas luteoviolacea]